MEEPYKSIVAEGLTAQIYEHLQQRILSLDLKPGDVLNLQELAKAYRVSVTPVREALRLLGRDGLVVTRPRSGTVVSGVDFGLVRQVWDARLIFELAAVDAACALGPDESVVARLRESVEQMRQMGRGNTLQEHGVFLKSDREFHLTFIRLLCNPVVEEIYDGLHVHTLMMRTWVWRGAPTWPEINNAEHAAIVDAWCAGDREELRAAVSTHVRNALGRICYRADSLVAPMTGSGADARR